MNGATCSKAIFLGGLLIALCATAVLADGPKDNIPSAVRPIPPIGNALSTADRESIQTGLDALGKKIDSLADQLKEKPELLGYLPDIRIYYNAVRYPLVYHETIDPANAPDAGRWDGCGPGHCATERRHGSARAARVATSHGSTDRCSRTALFFPRITRPPPTLSPRRNIVSTSGATAATNC